jgi:hypothetical protein
MGNASPSADHLEPLAVTVRRARELTGLRETTIWAYLRSGDLVAVRPPGTRRTLVDYDSLRQLLKPLTQREATPRRRGRPKGQASANVEASV